jgi:hypothetical protein
MGNICGEEWASSLDKIIAGRKNVYARVGGDGLVLLFWLAVCWIESQRGHLYHHGGRISQEGFVQRLVPPPATSRYIGSVRIISEAPLVCPNGC